MDEETETLDESLVNIKSDISDFTNGKISIMEDPDTYKSTAQILREISQIWDELTDKQQAGLAEKLFGKNRANIGVAIISNFEQAEAALKKMENSAGAADAEMAIITESISYKLNALQQTGVGIFQNLFQRDDMKSIIDGLTSVGEVIDKVTEKLGLFKTVLIGGGIIIAVRSLVWPKS